MPEHQQAFDVLKEALVNSTSSGLSRLQQRILLETNASLQGLGAVLS